MDCMAAWAAGEQTMSTPMILALALGLAMDTFAVAIAASVMLGSVSSRQIFRFAFHFGLFQMTMPIVGWAAGLSFEVWIKAWDHWVAFGLLSFIGGKAIAGAFRSGEDDAQAADPTRGLSLIVLSFATSIDALAVGISFAVLDVHIWSAVVIIGVVTGLVTMTGMLIGSRLGSRFGKRIEILGGFILILIGLKILVEHLTQ